MSKNCTNKNNSNNNMSSPTPRGLPGFLRRSMRNDMMTMYNNDYGQDGIKKNVNEHVKQEEEVANVKSDEKVIQVSQWKGKEKTDKVDNADKVDNVQQDEYTRSSSGSYHDTKACTTEEDADDARYTDNCEEETINQIDRKFRFFKSPSTDRDCDDHTNIIQQPATTAAALLSSTTPVEEQVQNVHDHSDYDDNSTSFISKRLLGFTSSLSSTIPTTTTTTNDYNIPQESIISDPMHEPSFDISLLPTATTSNSSFISTSPDTNNNSFNHTKNSTESYQAGTTAVVATTISTTKSSTPASFSSTATKPKQTRSMNYKEAEFEKVINEPVVNIASLRKLGWNGIPAQHRPQAWKILLGYLPTNQTRRAQALKRKRLEYLDIIKQHYDISDETRTHSEQETLRQVLVDVPRTAPDVPLFRNDLVRQSLSRILYLWACRHPASGYVQGINDLATPLIAVFLSEFYDNQQKGYNDDNDGSGAGGGSNMNNNSNGFLNINEPSLSSSVHVGSVLDGSVMDDLSTEDLKNVEADVYWCLTNLLAGIQDHYTSDQPGVQRMVMRLEDLVTRMDGELTHHLKSVGVEFIQFAFRWMNCLLLREFKLESVIRLWDTYLSEGDGAGFAMGFETFHVYVCAAFLCQFSSLLRTMEFDELFGFMQNVPTSDWADSEIEILLSQAFVLSTLFHGSDAHLAGIHH